ncbi:acyl-coenzyme A amino acid N-acyltransferase 1-like [Dendropsophus ebraccatus]|uniref:acyl-coenzyme A amino acid N-acyltransferase 1-like n=1 Tax=Dendropsophus ebraccatus TaxID=150705 RepID=UPI003831DAA7
MINLKVSPEISLVDEPVKIQVSGLQPCQKITLRAWLKDERGKIFHSQAFYVSDMEGNVDLENSPATGGDYDGVCPMGLFWALKPSVPFLRLIKRDVIGSPFHIHLELYSHLEFNPFPKNPPATTVCIERWYASPGVQRLPIRHGRIRGALFIPPGKGPFPGVIDLFGGVGGLIEFRSSLLASHGFASLALAYFGYDDLPKTLDHVDLKYFEEAVHFLTNHPKVSGAGVGVIGVSKGAEIALAMACFVPQVMATICINGAISVTGQNLSYGNLKVRGIPYQSEKAIITYSGAFECARIYGDPTDPENQESRLPIEKAGSPIMFLVGENDQIYDSVLYGKLGKARAEKYGKKDVYLRCYPGAGHLLEPPGSPLCPVSLNVLSGMPLMWGGELVGHCKAQEVSWRETLNFFRTNIPCSQQNKL